MNPIFSEGANHFGACTKCQRFWKRNVCFKLEIHLNWHIKSLACFFSFWVGLILLYFSADALRFRYERENVALLRLYLYNRLVIPAGLWKMRSCVGCTWRPPYHGATSLWCTPNPRRPGWAAASTTSSTGRALWLSAGTRWDPTELTAPEHLLTDSLTHGLTDSLTRWFTDSLIYWLRLTNSQTHCFTNLLTYWFTDSLIYWLIDSLTHWFTDSLMYWLTDSLTWTHCLTDLLTHWFTDLLIHKLKFTDLLIHWFTDSLIH